MEKTIENQNEHRLLMDENEAGFNSLRQRGKEVCAVVEKIAEAWAALEIGAFDNEALAQAMANRNAVQSKVMDQVESKIAELSIPSKILQQDLQETAAYNLRVFYGTVERLRRELHPLPFEGKFPLEAITVNEQGLPEINAQGQELLRETSRVYAETPLERNLYHKLKALEQAFNGVQEALQSSSYAGIRASFNPVSQAFSYSDNNMATLKPEAVKSLARNCRFN
ncbi:hypothetical protein CLV24_11984 [Pontibacter ummariensis]|uniref:Uncharacterized protein n=1 Tax=Pontibacter ummariensis TaxID=1610492 RepID=A0A239IYB9_9BACT|nr:hypothetical protein [Pontibacter ummariensis]PRY09033.1 hypothetical protein CLV24_11984 [Pontibacter ummariensis]SNS98776.1 hypothetical protein SAMN06296052_11984 [Pontibacter ummariensis]